MARAGKSESTAGSDSVYIVYIYTGEKQCYARSSIKVEGGMGAGLGSDIQCHAGHELDMLNSVMR